MTQMKNRLSSWLQTFSVPGVLILLALVMVLPGPVLAGTWSTTGSLKTARYYHTATRLDDGRVLVVGGGLTSGVTASAEIYNPSTKTWSDASPMTIARYFHTATLLHSGQVLVAGGHDGLGNSLDSVELYEPNSDTWITASSLATSRDKHTATLLPDGRVLVAAGAHSVAGPGTEYLTSAEIYDPSFDLWSSAGILTQSRERHTATLLNDGKVIVAAGYRGSAMNTSELYSGTWATNPPWTLSETRERHRATLLNNGKVLVTGGRYFDFVTTQRNSAELYTPDTKSWALTTTMATRREEHTATRLGNGQVLVVGGYNRTSGSLNSAELYDSADATWTSAGTMAGFRYRHTATTLGNGQVLIAGGYFTGPLQSCELYTSPGGRDNAGVLELLLFE